MISIVDDDVCARAAIEALVRSLGYLAVTFTSAEDFLGSNHVNDTSYLITEVHMPGLSGVELHHVRTHACHVALRCWCACDAEQIFKFCRPAIAMILILGFQKWSPPPGM
jgi:PleD family two-component response regulator